MRSRAGRALGQPVSLTHAPPARGIRIRILLPSGTGGSTGRCPTLRTPSPLITDLAAADDLVLGGLRRRVTVRGALVVVAVGAVPR